MLYDICMRSIERIEDLLNQEWENVGTLPSYPIGATSLRHYEVLDFEN